MSDMDGRTRPLLIRFLEKIQVDTTTAWHNGSPCWLWVGGGCEPSRLRAGRMYFEGGRRKQEPHIVAYHEFVGPVADGRGVERECDNWRCCSPLHLVLSDRQRGGIKGRKHSSDLMRALRSIRVKDDCWIVPHGIGNKKRVAPKPLLIKYFLGEASKASIRKRLCESSHCVNPQHYNDIDRQERTRQLARKYRRNQPLKEVDCKQCGKLYLAKKKGKCFDCLNQYLASKLRPCKTCGQQFKGGSCERCRRRRVAENPKVCESCGHIRKVKGKCRRCLRRQIIDGYGGKCFCCGETEFRFLTLDHKNDDGYKHLTKSGTRMGGELLVRWAIRNNYPDSLQVACYNCNCARAKEPEKQCPHVALRQYAFWWRDGLTVKQRRRKKDKLKVIQAYGGKCECCGETNAAFLTLDHVNDDGAKHRKESGKIVFKLTDWAIKNNYPDSLRLLCYNCNCGRELEPDKVCPHKKQESIAA